MRSVRSKFPWRISGYRSLLYAAFFSFCVGDIMAEAEEQDGGSAIHISRHVDDHSFRSSFRSGSFRLSDDSDFHGVLFDVDSDVSIALGLGTLVSYYLDDDGERVSVSSVRTYGRSGVPDGGYVHFYRSGNVRGSGTYKNGLLHGDMVIYYESGAIQRVIQYVNGNRQGAEVVFTESGLIMSFDMFSEGSEEGPFVRYSVDGLSPLRFGEIRDGRLHIEVDVEEQATAPGVVNPNVGRDRFYHRNHGKASEINNIDK